MSNPITDKIQVFDNAVPPRLFEKLKSTVESVGMTWFCGGTAYTNDDVPSFSFCPNENTPLYDLTDHCFLAMLDNINSSLQGTVFRYRYGLILRDGLTSKVHAPHIDFSGDHKVALLYLTTTDGNTTFYDADGKEAFSLAPVENRCVIFDGKLYHSSSTPTLTARRITLNVNISVDET